MGYGAELSGSSRHTRRRMAILTGVGVLHVGVFYALVTGLAGVVTMIAPPVHLHAHDDPTYVPIAPPTAQPTPKHHVTPIVPVAHEPDHSQVNPLGETIIELPLPEPTIGAGTLAGSTGDGVGILPRPLPSSSFAPRKATPRGNPGAWISPSDYPTADLREGNSGITGFRLTVGRDGRPQGCTITSSSGHPRLDAATCQLVSARAQFKPATDDTGAPTTGSYQSKVDWTIPER